MPPKVKRCVCGIPVLRNITSNGGEVLAVFCSLCTRPVVLNCPSCKKETKDLVAHFRVKRECWRKADPESAREYEKSKGSTDAANNKGSA